MISPRHCLWLLACLLGLTLGATPARATIANEYDLKAAFLFNFLLFTTWPEEVLPPPGEPFVIGILGADPFGPALNRIVAGETILGRPVVVRRFTNPAEIRNCRILFVCRSEQPRLAAVLDAARGKAVLTVSDIDRFAYVGGVIGMVLEQDKVRVQINVDRARENRLAIGAKLLRIARVISDVPQSLAPAGRKWPAMAE